MLAVTCYRWGSFCANLSHLAKNFQCTELDCDNTYGEGGGPLVLIFQSSREHSPLYIVLRLILMTL